MFAQYAAGCSAELVDAVADAGIGIDEPAPLDQTVAVKQQGKTALANLALSYLRRKREADRVDTPDAC